MVSLALTIITDVILAANGEASEKEKKKDLRRQQQREEGSRDR